MEDKIRQGDLYDFYGMLLNPHQREVFEDYVLNDLSLGEIAENNGVSRQGVHDLIRRCTRQMEEYESKMQLIHKFHLISGNIHEMEKILEEDSSIPEKAGKSLQKLTEEILEEI
ncbi:MAG: sigma factor-like helix-turn-helix DNA-binding protein [Lachnospiraceae bacterium]|jgi:predicted DNA-binding protein YlxM (UPF0122 family)|nr:sigma factor-like helix-turn-helix DNA-binding protein [Lachnospiraceae bacterium]